MHTIIFIQLSLLLSTSQTLLVCLTTNIINLLDDLQLLSVQVERVLQDRVANLDQEVNRLLEEREGWTQVEAVLHQQLDQLEQVCTNKQHEVDLSSEVQNKLAQKMTDLQQQLAAALKDSAATQEQLKGALEAAQTAERNAKEALQTHAAMSREIEQLRAAKDSAEEELVKAQEHWQEKQSEHDLLQKQMKDGMASLKADCTTKAAAIATMQPELKKQLLSCEQMEAMLSQQSIVLGETKTQLAESHQAQQGLRERIVQLQTQMGAQQDVLTAADQSSDSRLKAQVLCCWCGCVMMRKVGVAV